MKKFLLTAAAAISMQVAFAQTSAVTSAVMFQTSGTLDKAKAEIDKAVVHEKTKESAKAWYYKGLIYESMIGHPIYGSQAPADVLQQAFDAYSKVPALEANAKKKEFTEEANKRKENLYGHALNAGVQNYQEKKYDEALTAYALAQSIKPQDTTAYIYAAYAASGKEDYATAKSLFNKVVDLGQASPAVYSQLLYIASDIEKSDAAQLAVLEKARAKYPNDKTFMLTELDMYIKAGKEKESLAKLDAAIQADPSNANLLTVRGNLLERTKDMEGALASYRKAAEIDPANFDAQYNLGVFYFNKGANINNQVNKMSLADFQKKGKTLQAEAKKQFTLSLPHFEAALKAQPKDRTTAQSLLKAYTALGRTADAKRMDDLLQSL